MSDLTLLDSGWKGGGVCVEIDSMYIYGFIIGKDPIVQCSHSLERGWVWKEAEGDVFCSEGATFVWASSPEKIYPSVLVSDLCLLSDSYLEDTYILTLFLKVDWRVQQLCYEEKYTGRTKETCALTTPVQPSLTLLCAAAKVSARGVCRWLELLN